MAPVGAMAQGSAVRQACEAQIQQHCAGIEPGEGRLRACVKDNFAAFSEPCKRAMLSSVAVVRACKAEAQQNCGGIQPGGGRIQTCMKDHFTELTEPCKEALLLAKLPKE